MSDGLWWRKVKRGIIRDDHLEQVAFSLPQNIRCQVISWYMVAYMLADDDGVFDFEDGGIFALRCFSTIDDVTQIKEQMEKRGVIENVIGGKSTIYMINDWIDVEDSQYRKRPAMTADQRREQIAQKIKASKKEKAQAKATAEKTRKEIAAINKGVVTDQSQDAEISERLQSVIDKLPDVQSCPEIPEIPPEVLAERCFILPKKNSVTKNGDLSLHTQDSTVQDSTEQHKDITAQQQNNTLQNSTAEDSIAKENEYGAVAPIKPSAEADGLISDKEQAPSHAVNPSEAVNLSHFDHILSGFCDYFEPNIKKLDEKSSEKEHTCILKLTRKLESLVDKNNSGDIIKTVFLSVVEHGFTNPKIELPSELLLDKVWDFCEAKTKEILSLNDENDENTDKNTQKRKDSG